MNILDIAKQRFSVRNYLTKEISQETLETILEAAHVAPTAANMQPVKLLVVKSDEAKEKLETMIYRFCKCYGLKLPRRYRKCARKEYLAFAKSRKLCSGKQMRIRAERRIRMRKSMTWHGKNSQKSTVCSVRC